MLGYYLWLAAKSFRRNPGLTALMVGAIALGISTCIVTLTVYHAMSGNPIWWKNNVLEQELFSTRDRFHQFYERAKEAHSAGYRNALEVYYLCVVLGFRGLYADSWVAQQDAERFELPPTIEKWAAQVSMAIQLSPRPPIVGGGPMGPGAPPLNGQALLISSSMLAAVLGALAVAIFMLSNS